MPRLFGYVYKWRKSRSFWAKSVRSSIGRTVVRKASRASSFKIRLGKSSKLGMLIRYPIKGLFLSVYLDDIKLAGKEQNISPTWKILMKDGWFGRTNIIPRPCIFGLHSRECQISKDIVDNYRNMFGSRISAGATEKLPETKGTGKLDAETISSWSYDMEGHAKKCVEKYCELANKTTEQFIVQSRNTIALMTIILRKRKMNQWDNCPLFAHTLFWHVYIWHVLGDLIYCGLWTNLLVRSQNGQKLATNVWRVWSHTFIIHVNTNNIVMWVTQHNNAD